MGNKRNRRSRRLATPSPDREVRETRIDSSESGNITFLKKYNKYFYPNVQESLGEPNLENQLRVPSQISDDIQVWTQIVERKNTERIEKMREDMENELEAILKEIKYNKSVSTVTNPRFNVNEIQEPQPSGSRIDPSTGVRASKNETSDSENDDYPLMASKMKDLKHPAKPLFRSESDVDVTIHSYEESDIEEDYHMVTGANRQLHRQSSQKLNDTIGSRADQNLTKPLDPVYQIALEIEKLAKKNPSQSLFHPKTTLTFNGKKMRKMRNSSILKTYFIRHLECSQT